MAISVEWTAIVDGQVDADSPLNQLLMQAIKDDLYHLKYWLGKNYAADDDHDHDGVDSKAISTLAAGAVDQTAIANSAVGQGELKTGTNSGSRNTVGSTEYALSGADYNFVFQEYASGVSAGGGTGSIICGRGGRDIATWGANYSATGKYVVVIDTLVGDLTLGFNNRYVTASGIHHWIFILMENGFPAAFWESSDHPQFGNHPGIEHPFDSNTVEAAKGGKEIIVINPSLAVVEQIRFGTMPAADGGWLTPAKALAGIEVDYDRPRRNFLDVFVEDFEVMEGKQADWINEPISIGLPKIWNGKIVDDWRLQLYCAKDGRSVKITSVKRAISKPDYITPLQIRARAKGKGLCG